MKISGLQRIRCNKYRVQLSTLHHLTFPYFCMVLSMSTNVATMVHALLPVDMTQQQRRQSSRISKKRNLLITASIETHDNIDETPPLTPISDYSSNSVVGVVTDSSKRSRRKVHPKSLPTKTALFPEKISTANAHSISSGHPIHSKRFVTQSLNTTTPTNITETLQHSSNDTFQTNGQCNFEYQDLFIPPNELRPSRTLTTGQCFHWSVVNTKDVSLKNDDSIMESTKISAWGYHNATEWVGTLRVVGGETIIVMIQETPTTVLYRTLYKSNASLDVRSLLYSYFQFWPDKNHTVDSIECGICLNDLYGEWSTQCDRLKQIATYLPGVRIVNQDPWECLVSFICSSNNNIPRITKMLHDIRRNYGDHICSIPLQAIGVEKVEDIVGMKLNDLDNDGNVRFYSFPSLQQLTKRVSSEMELRNQCGMGYRAKYLFETIHKLHELGGESYLHQLRTITDPDIVQEKLLQFSGVGRKVADCVALFSLQQHDAIPVDIHVWNIARRDYGADSFLLSSSKNSTTETKSLTPNIYKQIGNIFRSRFPSYSGWAHSLLFVAELPSFRPTLPNNLVKEMDEFRDEEKARKSSNKRQKIAKKE